MTTLSERATTTRVATWVRAVVAALAVPQLVTGLWAVLDTRGFYDNFPGFGAMLVAAEPPYNAHLITDAGSGFLAVGVVLVLAALWGERRVVQLALVGLLAFAVPHMTYHLANPSPLLTDTQNALSSGGLVVSAVVPLVLLFFTRKEAR